MKSISLLALALIGCVLAAAELEVYIATNDYSTIQAGCPDDRFHIVLLNNSERKIKIFHEWNSWGYFNFGFHIKTPDGNDIVIKKNQNKIWGKNFPSYNVLEPNQTTVFEVELNESNWDGVKELMKSSSSEFLDGYEIRAAYGYKKEDNHPINEDPEVWTGLILSDWVKIRLYKKECEQGASHNERKRSS